MKTGVNNLLLILSIILCSINYSFAQDDTIIESKLYNNAIYGNVGIGGLYFTATGYYERILKQNVWNTNISPFVKVGFGAEEHWGGNGQYILAQCGLITGAKKHHFEMGAGLNYVISGDYQGDNPISGFVGWRFQKPGKSFLFRVGAGWPEAVYLGLGASF